MHAEIQKLLTPLADPSYKTFSLALLPGLNMPMLGVRLPALRRLAKQLARQYNTQALHLLTDETFEERMLQGMIIGLLQTSDRETLSLIKQFVPKINCWSICDSFCTGLHIARRRPETMWTFLAPYFKDKREYYFRFAAVTALCHFANGPFALDTFPLLNACPADGFYAKMAVAWAISVLCVHYPQQTLDFLTKDDLDAFTHNKAIQKIVESYRIDADIKSAAKALKKPFH